MAESADSHLINESLFRVWKANERAAAFAIRSKVDHELSGGDGQENFMVRGTGVYKAI